MIPNSYYYQNKVYAQTRQIDAQVTLTVNGQATTYGDTDIVQMNITEEKSILNDTLPSNQIDLTLKNISGNLDFFNNGNMGTLLASRPQIQAQFGLHVGWRFVRWTGYGDNTGAVSSLVEIMVKDISGNLILGQTPLSYTAISGGAPISAITDGVTASQSGNYPYWNSTGCQVVFDLGAMKELLEIDVWQYSAASDLRQTKFKLEVSPDNVNWTTVVDYSNNTQTQDPVNGWAFSVPFNIEWIPMGTFWVDSWKNDVGSLTVTLTGHDNLLILDNISIKTKGWGAGQTLYTIAQNLFALAGITNYNLDSSLNNFTATGGIQTASSARQVLQWIGIMAQCAVYQDRYGVIQIIPFTTVDKGSSYETYVSSQVLTGSLYSGYNLLAGGNNSSPTLTTNNGMKVIDHSQSYEVPSVTLEKSTYQINVKTYDVNGNGTDNVYTNPNLSNIPNLTINGQSYTIDIPFVGTTALAQTIANWFFANDIYNAVYQNNWRQNPVLECGDVCVVEGNYNFNNSTAIYKKARIYKQEFNYVGYLTGTTSSRGGI